MKRVVTLMTLLLAAHGAAKPVCAAIENVPATAAAWDTYSDTWVATDALGRSLPTAAEVGPPRPGKFVGMFYFLWLGQHGNQGPFDITRILEKDPTAINNPNSPLWGPLGVPHHWGESVFNYYVSDDEWVLRKNAQMLADAGVDVVFFDVTNQLTYPRSYLALCKVWSQIRKEGGKTPQIGFLTPFWSPARVTASLYTDLYKPGLYSDLWFRWEGKPLILADPRLIREEDLKQADHVPAELQEGHSLGQTFRAEKPFLAVGGEFPTYRTTDAGMTLSLFSGGPGGKLLAKKTFQAVSDNATVFVETGRPLAPGEYYLEMTGPRGHIGWWSYTGDRYAGGRAYEDGLPSAGDRALHVRYEGEAVPQVLSPAADAQLPSTSGLIQEIRQFFTFRKPQPDYFQGPTGPEQWGWLEVYPQHEFFKTPGKTEQMVVGVAQNAVDGKLSVLSNPRSHGRSFHDGAEPGPEGQDFSGRNFAEQWDRALKVDPAFIFVTGWNEWIAGRFGANSPFYGSGPVSFVDEFNHEFSRDIEPVIGGHTDSYYYQLVQNIRRFKGARALPPASPPCTLRMNGNFAKWQNVQPEYRDDPFDTIHRDHPGWGRGVVYRNDTGRNDFIAAKVTVDANYVYFYVRTRQPITNFREPDWMLLLLKTHTGGNQSWEGFDYILNRQVVDGGSTWLERSTGGWNWQPVSKVQYHVRGPEMEMSVPRADLGLPAGQPVSIDFKWMDNVGAQHDMLNLYRNGDTAPNGRFAYHAVLLGG